MLSKIEIVQNKLNSKESLELMCNGWRIKGSKIVFTNGCFDILHKGHIQLLLEAASLGNKLIVGINTDASIKKLKGESRPVNDENSRALALAAQLYVDAVVFFEEQTPLELIKSIRPDVIVKGGDYTPEGVVGSDFVNSYGGSTVIIPLVNNYSTTALIEKIQHHFNN